MIGQTQMVQSISKGALFGAAGCSGGKHFGREHCHFGGQFPICYGLTNLHF